MLTPRSGTPSPLTSTGVSQRDPRSWVTVARTCVTRGALAAAGPAPSGSNTVTNGNDLDTVLQTRPSTAGTIGSAGSAPWASSAAPASAASAAASAATPHDRNTDRLLLIIRL